MPRPSDPVAPEEIARLTGRIGRLLLANGADTGHALRRIDEVSAALGHPVNRLVTAEAIVVAAGDGHALQTRVGPAIPAMAVNMGALVAVEQVVERLRAHQTDVETAGDALDDIDQKKHDHGAIAVVVGVAVTAASLARLFGGAWPVVIVAFVAGLSSTILRRGFARWHWNPIAATFLTALVSGIVAGFSTRLTPGSSPVLSLTAAGMILVPGVPLLNGVRDLFEGHATVAVARFAFGTTTILVIGFALFLAATIAGTELPVGQGPGTLPVGWDLLFSATAAAGYAMLFNVPLRAIPACIACGMASHGLRTALGDFGMNIAASSLLGAAAAGIIARFAARLYRVPPVTFAFPGIVAMIPGSYGFRAGIAGLHLMTMGASASSALVAEALSLTVITIVVTIAIGIGLALALEIPPEHHLPVLKPAKE